MTNIAINNLDFSAVHSIAVIGECMLELSSVDGAPDHSKKLGFGGDTLNTSIYLSRSGHPVHYVTALGDDKHSNEMLAAWRNEGINTRYVQQLTGRVPGLYMIETDGSGERSFYYWRDSAPAREMLNTPVKAHALFDELMSFDFLYFSGVTLSLFNAQEHERFIEFLQQYRKRGGMVAFDSNFRPQRWPDLDYAKDLFKRIYACVDLALPTLEDDLHLFSLETTGELTNLLRRLGVNEIIVKQGAAGCLVEAGGDSQLVLCPSVDNVVDTTGAGDSFNAGYLSARLSGKNQLEAAQRGHHYAGQVIQKRGAIVPIEAIR